MSAMPVGQQVALARPRSIGPPTHISNVTRQIVPPFLQKLYEMVNDPKNEELIRWSEAGDSFFVLDHERFANEVLGRWFKHRNFSSFVRQLNMYGFHKIPHLQQGVLKSDTDKEFWNFAHANFRKGQPDLLCLIQRKKQTAQQGDEGAGVPVGVQMSIEGMRVEGDGHAGTSGAPSSSATNGVTGVATSPGGALTLSSGQVLDIQSIVSGIAAIRRHQTTISAELNELRKSNQMLWQEAMVARTRHQKQQDTINKIVKFLAGMFGNHADSNGEHTRVVNVSDDEAGVVSMGMGMNVDREQNASFAPRMRQRLMIEAARNDGDDTEMSGEPLVETPRSVPSPAPSAGDSISIVDQGSQYGGISSSTPNGHAIGFDMSTNHSAAKAPVPPSGRISPAPSDISTHTTDSTSTPEALSTSTTLPTISAPSASTTLPTPSAPSITTPTPIHATSPRLISRPPSAQRHDTPAALDWDPTMQSVFNALNAQQIQQLLVSLAAAQPFDSNFAAQGDPSGSQMTTYQPSPFDFSTPLPSPGFHSFPSFDTSVGSSTSTTSLPDPVNIPMDPMLDLPTEGLISFDNDPQGKVERNWRAAEDIDKDVSALDNGINQLITMFGLQPEDGVMANGAFGSEEPAVIPSSGSSTGVGAGTSSAHEPAGASGDVNMINGVCVGSSSEPQPLHTEGNDFDLDSFLSTFPSSNTQDEEHEAESAFLDEVPVPKAGTGVGAKGKKRKSDLTEEIRAIQKDNNASKAAVAVGVGGAGAGAGAGLAKVNGKVGNGAEPLKRRKVQEEE